MINALLSINADLGSSIALRYAEALSRQIDIQVHGIHVVDPERLDSAPGSGWVRKTWENTVIGTERENILRFLEVEKVHLPFLKIPKVIIGDRTEKIIDEIRNGEYRLFLEGVPPTTHPGDFEKLVHSRLYRSLPCPVLVVKNLLPPTRAALLLDDPEDLKRFPAEISDLFKQGNMSAEAVFPKPTASDSLLVEDVDLCVMMAPSDALPLFKLSREAKVFEGSPKAIAGRLRDYGMIVACMHNELHRTDAMLELLGRVASPVLICSKGF